MTKLVRYGLASLGPVGSAGAQFLLSLILIRALDSHQFGGVAFLLVALQLGMSVWSALFCAPLLVLLTRTPRDATMVDAIFSTSLLLGAGAIGLFSLIAWALGLSGGAAATFGLAAGVTLWRWFGRSHAYAIGAPRVAMASDLIYAAMVLAGAGLIWWRGAASVDAAFLTLLIGAIAGMVPFGRAFMAPQLACFSLRAVSAYRAVWREFSGWSLIGVVSTEATMNSQAYLVTLFAGASAFAPIAATSLLIRPITVTTNALSDYERAQMALDIGQNRISEARAATSMFRAMLVLAWIGTVALAVALIGFAPRLIFPARYTIPVLTIGAASWIAVALVRALRAPDSALLQAAGAFRTLAWASIYSSVLSIAAVLVTLIVAAPLWTTASILVGETAFAIWVWRAGWRWQHGRSGHGTGAPPAMAAAP